MEKEAKEVMELLGIDIKRIGKADELLVILRLIANMLLSPYIEKCKDWKNHARESAREAIVLHMRNMESIKGKCPERARSAIARKIFSVLLEDMNLVTPRTFIGIYMDFATGYMNLERGILPKERIESNLRTAGSVIAENFKDPCGPKTKTRKLFNEWMSGGK